ncbi:MAG: hypothetical protein KGP28_05000 [Bdellovibrionales bacterium]|nr:hypothetical protein [Bdellovibrionales bacterium]
MNSVYTFKGMRNWFAAATLVFFTGLESQSAFSSIPRKALNPTALSCLLREGRFFTEILFTKNSEGTLVGEMGNFVSTPDRGRRFLNGLVFFDLEVEPRLIQGNTGDKRGNISAFRLYPAYKSLNGEWIYEQFDRNSAPSQVRFNCKYRD